MSNMDGCGMIMAGGRVPVSDGMILCPNCRRKKLLRLLRSSRGEHILLHCNRCGLDSIVNIGPGPSATLVEIVPRGGCLSLRA